MTVRLVFTGDVEQPVVDAAVTHMLGLGFTLVTAPGIGDATLVEIFMTEYDRSLLKDEPEIDNQYAAEYRRAIHALAGGTTLGELLSLSYAQFIEHRHALGRGANWLPESEMLTYMIENGLRFADVDPAVALGPPIQSLGLEARVRNALTREGILWVGLLRYTTAKELLEIRSIGKPTVSLIRSRLPEGIRFKDE